MSQKIELLMPAKNVLCGIEAINHGADAVYIGASCFGARSAAGNSMEDIAQLVDYAHLYSAKVFVTVNTILDNEQLEQAQNLIWQCYQLGVDAVIIQDVGILELDLPPIALHASTQMNNTTPEKVKFLQQQGFSRVVLARELSLQQIKAIHTQTDIELEAFVHGALCVSYSGQCYMSQYMNARSANKGQCAQCCRLPYHLEDKNGKILMENKHLLSLKDLDRSLFLKKMIDAGVSSFKVEGRLKDLDYIKNIASYYRQKLDFILSSDNDKYQRASVGKTYFFFEPEPKKTFSRGNTDYFLEERQPNIVQLHTPKSTGEYIGKIEEIKERYFSISTDKKLSNGDGLCLMGAQTDFIGFRINTMEGKRIYPSQMPFLEKGLKVYRNHDHEFQKALSRKTAERKIGLNVLMEETQNGFKLTLTEERNISISLDIKIEKTVSENQRDNLQEIQTQFSKLGNTLFELQNIEVEFSQNWFIPRSLLSQWKRDCVDLLLEKIKCEFSTSPLNLTSPPALSKGEGAAFQSVQSLTLTNTTALKSPHLGVNNSDFFQGKTLDYSYNVLNDKAKDFYIKQGAEKVLPAFEQQMVKDAALMTCKYCIKYELGFCPKQRPNTNLQAEEPLFLIHNHFRFRLEFDCKECLMKIKSK